MSRLEHLRSYEKGRITRQILEGFLLDVRRLWLIYGTQARVADACGVKTTTVRAWFSARKAPLFAHYCAVKELIARELGPDQPRLTYKPSEPKRTTEVANYAKRKRQTRNRQFSRPGR